MSAVAPANSTMAYIRTKVRRLTASSGESSLRTADLDQYVNNFYSQNFPSSIKTDQMRSVYTFYTRPYIDRYPLDVNYNQGVRAPVYVEGIQGNFFKDRQQFYTMWPRWPTKLQPASGDGTTATFTFTIPGPFLSKEVVIGSVAVGGNAISVADDGNGVLQLQVPNPRTSVPAQTTNPAVPGMYNVNNGSPGLNNPTNIGTVNYVTGVCALTFPASYIPASGELINVWVSQYQTGRPYSVLFWNNEFTIRPVPKIVHKVEIETYLTPVQFMLSTDNPIMNQWAKYLSYGAAIDILTDRQDFDGVDNLMPTFKYEEGLVLERQGVEEIGQRNSTIYSQVIPIPNGNFGFGQGYW